MESRLLQILVVLGVPGAALGIFYLLLKQFGFEFSKIGSTASAVIAILFLLLVGGVTFFALHRWAPSNGNNPNSPEDTSKRQSMQLVPCESGWCDPVPGSSGEIEFYIKFTGEFKGKIDVKNLKPNYSYRLSIHGKEDKAKNENKSKKVFQPGNDLLPLSNPNLVERYADIVDFSTDSEGNATKLFQASLREGYYSVDVRVKNNVGTDFKIVLYRDNITFTVN
jgi:hypothetical protein